MRLAIFFTPPADHRLAAAAARWLGRDAFSGAAVEQPAVAGLSPAELHDLTALPRRYGFHATLKAPFRIADGYGVADVTAMIAALAHERAPVSLGRLGIARIGSFLALIPGKPTAALDRLAGDVVRVFDQFRAPLTDEEIENRRPDRLSARQREKLARWGYPYVFEDYRFHMTLTGPLSGDRQARVMPAAEAHFGACLGEPVVLDALALFVEPDPPGDFIVRTRVAFDQSRQPVDAA